MEEKKKKVIFPVIALIFVAILVIALGTYAYWQITRKQTNRNVVGTACLDITFGNESNDILLENAWPTSDSDGANLTPYTFTITNTCDTPVNYTVALESVADQSANNAYLDYNYIRVKLDSEGVKTYGALGELTNDTNQSYTIRDTKEINHHTLDANDSVTHNLRLWIKEDTPLQNQDETLNTNKYFFGKIKIIAGQNIEGDEPVASIVSGDLNTVGSEVAIGDEHFYVIGDDTENSGNVKLLAKYNLLVGRNRYADGTYDQSQCEEAGGQWDDKDDQCSIDISSSIPGYNLQSSSALGVTCSPEESNKVVAYLNTNSSDCDEANGTWNPEANACVYMVDVNETQYDNITSLGTSVIMGLCEPYNELGAASFTDLDEKDGPAYWYDSQSDEYLSSYAIQTGQTYRYVYYDNTKNIDSHNAISTYVNAYRTALQSEYGVTVSEARLISFEELIALGCGHITAAGEDFYTCTNSYSWLYDRSYWTGSAADDSHIITVEPKVGMIDFEEYDYDKVRKNGVRPVISVAKSIFN